MKRTFLALSFVLVACGDDASSDDDREPEDPGPQVDAARPDGSRGDAATDRMDAARDASASEELPDGEVPSVDASAPDANTVVDASSFDAQVNDASRDASTDAGMCVVEGENCSNAACCADTACVTSSAKPFQYCAETCAQDSDCETGCCTELDGSGTEKVCAAQSYCDDKIPSPTAPLTGVNCYNDLNVYSHSGKYMGRASTSYIEDDAVCGNSFDPYGKNGNSPDNMWRFSSDAFSTSIGFSAIIGCGSNFPVLAYVSKFTGVSNKRVIDPDNLCTVLDNSNF